MARERRERDSISKYFKPMMNECRIRERLKNNNNKDMILVRILFIQAIYYTTTKSKSLLFQILFDKPIMELL